MLPSYCVFDTQESCMSLIDVKSRKGGMTHVQPCESPSVDTFTALPDSFYPRSMVSYIVCLLDLAVKMIVRRYDAWFWILSRRASSALRTCAALCFSGDPASRHR